MQTKIIKYNLNDRGRHFRGKERHFDVQALCRVINGGACQEKVKNRDMLGYYGHWPRIKFGMNPAEGGIDGGKPSYVEPALVTVFLKAYPDGTIEHQAEFLDNDSGKVAQKLYQGRVGGFSSVIDQSKPDFYGFDYVLEPNYTTNRGYALDDISGMTLDDVNAAIQGEQLRGVLYLLDSAEKERDRATRTIERQSAEIEELLDTIERYDREKRRQIKAAMDSANRSATERMMDDAKLFRSISLGDLPKIGQEPDTMRDALKDNPLYQSLLNHFRR